MTTTPGPAVRPQVVRGEGRLPRGARASVHLGFEVAFELRSLSFAFEPGGLDEPTVLVALGDIQPR